MIVQLSIYPSDADHLSGEIRRVSELLEGKNLSYEVGPIGTCIQGSWESIFEAIKECHEDSMTRHNRVVTTIIIDDRRGKEHSLTGAVRAVENSAEF